MAEARERVKAAPISPEASLAYGQALRKAGHDAEALTELRRGVALAANRPDAAALLKWEIARTHIAKREFEAARGTCNGIGKTPSAADVSHVCAAEAHLLWRRGTEALGELAALEKGKAPRAEVAYAAKLASGRARELESMDAEAEASYREAIAQAESKADAHVLLGTLLQRTGRDGVSSLKRAVSLDPHDPVAQFELGRALPAGSTESLAALERAIGDRPTYLEALRGLTDGYVAARRLPDAKKTVETVLRLAPNDVFSHVVAGHVALAEGRADDAIKAGELASKLMPNVAAAKLLVADAWAKKGEIDLALEAYQAAYGLDHGDPTPLVNAARACVAAGRVTSAKAFATRATKDFAAYGPGWVALGDALVADKEPQAARSAYETAKKAKDVDALAVDEKLLRLK
ncbi:TPR domain protein, putative component of TonB system [Labilithrix luteola]|uniref:TPR domain protein, putative component of TonB system n=1 Tax=Labilithrix luteola TaxID=1391654 RepID=A0A0K1Q8V1_9BACT|nr:TPR domain protein, putative component of TonB system [Labilithrix luteola]